MSTATAPRESAPVDPTQAPPPAEERKAVPRWVWALAVIALWAVGWFFFNGRDTLILPGREHTALHESLTHFRDAVIAGRESNPIVQFTYSISSVFSSFFAWMQTMVSVPDFPRPVPQIGWLGVTAVSAWLALAVANVRIAILVAVTLTSFGFLGYWTDAIDLLLVTTLSIFFVVLIGMPLAVLVGTNATARTVITWVLDLMQTMPTFVYLIPIVLFFGIGPPGAMACTLIYALPPLIRIAGYGIGNVSPTTIEATDSSGQTRWQRLTKVQIPMARKTIIVGLNQSTMAALAMAVIASYISGPGLGKPVLQGLIEQDLGGALVPGLLIVAMAIMLDRATTAASERKELASRGQGLLGRRRAIVLVVTGVIALVALWASRTYAAAAAFPLNGSADAVGGFLERTIVWIVGVIGGAAEAFKNAISYGLLNPMQSLLAQSPWWLTAAAILALALVIGRVRALVTTAVCLAGIWYFDLWYDAMVTLNMTLVGTLLVMVLGVVFGVWIARSHRADLVMRPILDAGQTIPAFVYLIPVLALFDVGRFTAIVAGIVYAAPAAIKLVADGVKGVSPTTLEAARSSGTTTMQEIRQVQLPMAKGSLVLATNQGLLYILAMVVIGGMVGAGALGYDVVLGFSRSEEWGKGAAAGITIVLLGIMIDRITRAAAASQDRHRDLTKRTWFNKAFGESA